MTGRSDSHLPTGRERPPVTDALQRTVRRCTALLLLPLSVLTVRVTTYVNPQTSDGLLPSIVTIGVPLVLVVGSVAYLAGSWLASSAGPPEPPADEAADAEEES